MRLVHFSDKPIKAIHSKNQTGNRIRDLGFKPWGLWVSVEGNGDGWSDWIEGENYRNGHYKYATEVELTPEANILYIKNAKQLDAFTRKYADKDNPFFKTTMSAIYIKWQEVANLYDGIIISPYIWARRLTMHVTWYYSWDCASGCIWNAKAVKIKGGMTYKKFKRSLSQQT